MRFICTVSHWAFQSTRPARGATAQHAGADRILCISIHAPREGRDVRRVVHLSARPSISIHAPREGRDKKNGVSDNTVKHFNPRAPRGARRKKCGTEMGFRRISIHAPREGRDCMRTKSPEHRLLISIHAPREGRDANRTKYLRLNLYFNPRAPRGARLSLHCGSVVLQSISIHAPREGRDASGAVLRPLSLYISIHAPREGRDGSFRKCLIFRLSFQSTRPARGATIRFQAAVKRMEISIHAPREGRDLLRCAANAEDQLISIHAPREGRDIFREVNDGKNQAISIHAPREGRDDVGEFTKAVGNEFQSTRPARGATGENRRYAPDVCNFNPRAPRGARQYVHVSIEVAIGISIHAPREGRDQQRYESLTYQYEFQSTRPARGATARRV